MPTTDISPNYESYHQSITKEIYALKNRIRNLVKHWPTDGEYKEVALRTLLRRHLPASVIVGRGFIVTPNKSSTQIDILIVNANKPTLFRDGDLLIVTPDAVLGVIEVKTELSGPTDFASALTKLSKVEAMCHEITEKDSVWSGLFSFEGKIDQQESILRAVGQAHNQTGRAVNCISCGPKVFIRYWDAGDRVNSPVQGPVWHSYELPDVAPSYFMGNLVDWISAIDNKTTGFAWFPVLAWIPTTHN